MIVIILGTIRRFLEHFGDDIELVVFVLDGTEVSLLDGNFYCICT